MQVSIRAPAWGATMTAARTAAAMTVSIRAPAWGATGDITLTSFAGGVSIRAPAWGATLDKGDQHQRPAVSIRAPAWGATRWFRRHFHSFSGFNSRSRMGSDLPTSPWRRRRNGFNSRSRMGSDGVVARVFGDHRKFQFALPHGERRGFDVYLITQGPFQFALPHGERR